MKKGISFYSLPHNADIKEAIAIAAKAKYDGFEPVLSEEGYLNMKSTEKDILAIKKMGEESGLEVASVGVWSLWDNNLAADDEKTRNYAMDIIKKQIECAALLNADTILIVPGYVGCEFSPNAKNVRYDLAYDRAQECISKLIPYAQGANVNIGVENVWNKFLLSPIEMSRFIDELDSEYVGAYFDVGNIMYIGFPDQWIEILDFRIKKIHFCDYKAAQAGLGAFCDLLAGDVDYKSVMQSLKKVKYDDYCTVEILPQYKNMPTVAIESNKHALDRIFEEYGE